MHFEGTVDIAAPRDKVWAFVIDPEQVGQCGPGVESIDVVDDTHFKVVAKVGIGFISAKFAVNMEFAELT
jgi:carbon monoxide dehydrogenase subunit G